MEAVLSFCEVQKDSHRYVIQPDRKREEQIRRASCNLLPLTVSNESVTVWTLVVISFALF